MIRNIYRGLDLKTNYLIFKNKDNSLKKVNAEVGKTF